MRIELVRHIHHVPEKLKAFPMIARSCVQIANTFESETTLIIVFNVVYLVLIPCAYSLPFKRDAKLIGFVIAPINAFSGREMSFDLWRDPFWLLAGGAISLGAGLVSGVPIARSLSAIQPVRVLKGDFWGSAKSPLASVMIVIQFTIAIGLSIAAVSAFRQLKFMQEYDIGFRKEEVIVAQVSWVRRDHAVTLMDELRKIPGVKDVTGALRRLGNPIDCDPDLQ